MYKTLHLKKDLENYISEKAAIFVADGIRYSLKGRVSIDIIKSAVANNCEYIKTSI